MTHAHNIYPFTFLHLEEGIKYLGFQLKPNDYRKQNWMWLVTKIKKKIKS